MFEHVCEVSEHVSIMSEHVRSRLGMFERDRGAHFLDLPICNSAYFRALRGRLGMFHACFENVRARLCIFAHIWAFFDHVCPCLRTFGRVCACLGRFGGHISVTFSYLIPNIFRARWARLGISRVCLGMFAHVLRMFKHD